MEVSEHAAGTFSWTDLGTTDQNLAKEFYESLFGWDHEDQPLPDGWAYTMFRRDGKTVAGAYTLEEAHVSQGVPPHWNCHVAVENVEKTAEIAASSGGQVIAGPIDVPPDLGRTLLVQDPSGAMIGCWQPIDFIGASILNEPGSMCWNQLVTADVAGAIRFYSGLFDWNPKEEEFGPFSYTTFYKGDQAVGGVMAMTENMGNVPPHWEPTFAVTGLDTSIESITLANGGLLSGPHDSQFGRYAVVHDPQRAVFGLIDQDQTQTG
jgi:uncharacterized protein